MLEGPAHESNHNTTMKQLAWTVALAALTLTSTALAQRQGSPKNNGETYVLEVGSEMVTLADFKHVYGKNNRDSVYTIEALDDYMELFVNFKLKVLEAEAMGMDTACLLYTSDAADES